MDDPRGNRERMLAGDPYVSGVNKIFPLGRPTYYNRLGR